MIGRRLSLLAFAAMLAASIAGAQPVVRVTVRPGRHLVGQPVNIQVQVLVPNYFMSSPRFPPIEMSGAVVTMPDDSGTNLNDTIDGQSYAGIQKTYVLVAQTAGKYTLPPTVITFRYAREPGTPTDGSVTLPPFVVEIEWPPGMTPPPGEAAAVVAKVTIEQTLDRNPASLHAGDALTRTIVTTATNTQAMFIPPPAFTAPDGVKVYRKDPVLTDLHGERGEFLAGHRTDRVVYMFERPGTYDLPAYEVPWFDTQVNRRQTARATAIAVTVAAAAAATGAIAPEAPPAPAPSPSKSRAGAIAVAAGGATIVLAGAWALRHVFLHARQAAWAWCALAWAALRRDRARHLPPLNPF